MVFRKPEIDLSSCKMCKVCVEICPDVFILMNDDYIDVIERESYSEEAINEAIACCPSDCIHWNYDNTTESA
ncbi:MAG: ferredoxin [Deltaproteobacteria bacterium]|nr:ferredoxin [Deltaproteobacteria bacterium]MBW2067920.1 ferredoxin [Deltaproteobacteria bacterium]